MMSTITAAGADSGKSQKPVSFILPASFQPREYLKGPLIMRCDDARWLVSTIVRKTANRDTDLWGCVRLHSDILRRNMHKHTSAEIIRALESGGAIETAPYCAGIKAKGYRLAGRYLGDRCVRVPACDPRLIERVQREQERLNLEEQRSRWKPVHFALADEQRHVTISPEADSILDGLPEHTRLCQDVLVSNIRYQQHSFSVGTTGRCFNSITGLKRELRAAVRISGQKVGSVDIRCAQPALLAMLMVLQYPPTGYFSRATYKHTSATTRPPVPVPFPYTWAIGTIGRSERKENRRPEPDLASFAAAACSGSLYRDLASLLDLHVDDVKKRFLVDVLAKKGRYPSKVEDVFRKEFPTVYRFIKQINADDYSALIRLLQQAESWLVVEHVAAQLVSRGCRTVTLHDAVFSTSSSIEFVASTFRDVLNEIGFPLSLKREDPW